MLLALLSCSLWSAPGAASPALLEQAGELSPRQAFAERALASGSSAAYFNPALLPHSDELSVGLALHARWLDLSLQPRPDGFDVPAEVYRARAVDDSGDTRRLTLRPLPTQDLRSERGGAATDEQQLVLTLGGSLSLLEGALGIGLHVSLPLSGLQHQSPFYSDEREQYFSNSLHFERYGDRLRGVAMSLGVGWEPWRALSMGFGATLLNDATTHAAIYVPDAADQSVVYANPEIELGSRLAWHAGLVLRPLSDDRLRIAATVHDEASLLVEADTELQFWDYDYPDEERALTQRLPLRYGCEPLRAAVALAGTVDAGGWRWTPHGQLLWSRWSQYRDRHDEQPLDWADVLTPSVGLALERGPTALSAGVLYAPSPVPLQEGRSSYVDNDRVAGQLGAAWTFAAGRWSARLGIVLQLQRLIERSQSKQPDAAHPLYDELPDSVDLQTGEPIEGSAGLQTNSPGFPGFASSGWVTTGRIVLSLTPESDRAPTASSTP